MPPEPPPERVRNKDPIDRADQIPEAAGRIRDTPRSVSERREDIFGRQSRRPGDARVIRSKGMEPMGVGSCDERSVEMLRDFDRTAIRV